MADVGRPVVTGYMSSKMRHHCIRDGCYLGALPSWDDILECFPRGIRPTDVDGMVEINDHFLFIEEKRSGASLLEGQRQALRRLATRPRVTVLYIRAGVPDDVEILVFGQGPPGGWQPMSRPMLLGWLRAWSVSADTGIPMAVA